MEWMRPSGNELETNDLPATIAYCKKMGFVAVGSEQKPISKMDKDELEAYAIEKFGIDIDKRKSLKDLRSEVRALEEE